MEVEDSRTSRLVPGEGRVLRASGGELDIRKVGAEQSSSVY